MARNMANIAKAAHRAGVYFSIENPSQSLICNYFPMKALARLAHGTASVRPVVTRDDETLPVRHPVTQQGRRGSRLAVALATETGVGPSSSNEAAALQPLPTKYRHSVPSLRS